MFNLSNINPPISAIMTSAIPSIIGAPVIIIKPPNTLIKSYLIYLYPLLLI